MVSTFVLNKVAISKVRARKVGKVFEVKEPPGSPSDISFAVWFIIIYGQDVVQDFDHRN
jgi:hypothetical protein